MGRLQCFKLSTFTSLPGGIMIKSVKITFLISFTTFFLTMSSAFAAQKVIAKIFQKSNNDQSILYINVDDKSDAVGFRFDILNSDGEVERNIPISLQDLKKGKVVLKRKGSDVITLKGSDIESHNGGYIQLTYLKHWHFFKRNKYKTIELLLDRVGDQWELQLAGQNFTELFAHDHSKGIHKFSIKK
jgi:hypothetical protein